MVLSDWQFFIMAIVSMAIGNNLKMFLGEKTRKIVLLHCELWLFQQKNCHFCTIFYNKTTPL